MARWRWVGGYEGRYMVSDVGTMRSYVNGKWGTSSVWKPHPTRLSPQGYPMASLSKEGLVFTATVSRLVLEAFVGPAPENKPYACHGDRNPQNNKLSNLRWGSNADNQADRVKHGTSNRGSRNGRAKLGEADIRTIKGRLAAGETQASIANDFNVDPSAISYIKTGRNWASV